MKCSGQFATQPSNRAAPLQKLDEKRQLARRRHRRRTVPLDMDPPCEGGGYNRRNRRLLYYRLLTQRETRQRLAIRIPHNINDLRGCLTSPIPGSRFNRWLHRCRCGRARPR